MLLNVDSVDAASVVRGGRGAITPLGEKRAAGIKGTYDEKYQEYEKGNWTTEHRNDPYPEESKGKWHHPDYSEMKTEKVQETPHKAAAAGQHFVVGVLSAIAMLAVVR